MKFSPAFLDEIRARVTISLALAWPTGAEGDLLSGGASETGLTAGSLRIYQLKCSVG
jgi:hypothetical protein